MAQKTMAQEIKEWGKWHTNKRSIVSKVVINEKGDAVAEIYSGTGDVSHITTFIAAAPVMYESIFTALAMAQEHDPKTGFYKPVDPYKLAEVLRVGLSAAQGISPKQPA